MEEIEEDRGQENMEIKEKRKSERRKKLNRYNVVDRKREGVKKKKKKYGIG